MNCGVGSDFGLRNRILNLLIRLNTIVPDSTYPFEAALESVTQVTRAREVVFEYPQPQKTHKVASVSLAFFVNLSPLPLTTRSSSFYSALHPRNHLSRCLCLPSLPKPLPHPQSSN